MIGIDVGGYFILIWAKIAKLKVYDLRFGSIAPTIKQISKHKMPLMPVSLCSSSRFFARVLSLASFSLLIQLPVQLPAHGAETKKSISAWLKLSNREKTKVESYATDYKAFIHQARTELSFVSETVKLVEANGFSRLTEKSPMNPGARYYDVNRDRAMTLIVVGKKAFEQGFRVVGTHIDSPRIELKGRPLYEKQDLALFQTYVHGGIKNYQWVNVPLALVGRVDKKDGSHVNISVGLKPDEPVFIVPDLAPHVDKSLRKRVSRDVIKAEELDVLVASKPGKDSPVIQQVVKFLKDEYDISVADLVSAELSLVPAMKPRDVGFDRSMVAAYGQDDKAAAFASVKAIMAQQKPQYTAMAFLVDNEEVGNINNTGAESSYLRDLMGELIYQQLEQKKAQSYSDHFLRQALKKTKVVSADVNPGVNPNWAGVWDLGNAPKLGFGVNLKLYGGGFNANSEYIAWTREYLDDAEISWQTSTYKGKASGGTIGSDLSRNNMDV
ncbi:MAG: aspartyl aminopeptidase, partial [Phenylobacterium sp.]